jgi:hypothetical protein
MLGLSVAEAVKAATQTLCNTSQLIWLDLPVGGSSFWAEIIKAVKRLNPYDH